MLSGKQTLHVYSAFMKSQNHNIAIKYPFPVAHRRWLPTSRLGTAPGPQDWASPFQKPTSPSSVCFESQFGQLPCDQNDLPKLYTQPARARRRLRHGFLHYAAILRFTDLDSMR
jgi:hypothetical protein